MRKSYSFSPLAAQDIDKITDYSIQLWGKRQARKYIADIKAEVRILADNPKLGRKRDHLRIGYRKYPARSHVIFYRLIDNGIDIIRILHQNMDAQSQL